MDPVRESEGQGRQLPRPAGGGSSGVKRRWWSLASSAGLLSQKDARDT